MKINKSNILFAMNSKNIQTQRELAERLGMSRSQLSQMLSDDFCPIKTNVINLMNELSLSFNDVIIDEVDAKMSENTLISEPAVQYSLFSDYLDRYDYKLIDYVDVKEVVPKKNYSVLETFAGAGGLALGLEQAGLRSVGAIEIDKWAAETLRINRPEWNVFEGDINEIADIGIGSTNDFTIEGSVDVLSGGYPCQSFSYAGLRNGLEDTRGTLFYPYSKLLQQLKPKVFIAENVKGLVNHDGGKTLEKMLEVFQDTGYQVQWNVLNAWDYDVAQKRERIVIVGIRNDLIDAQSKPYKFPKPLEYKPVLKDVLTNVPTSAGVKYSEKKRKVLDLVPPGGCWVDLPDEIAKDYMGASYNSGGGRRGMARRMSWDEPSLTLTTSPSQKQTERCHPSETRPFTVREYARIQSFPDDWAFAGGMGSQYKQIGNAVPVNLGKYIGLSVIDYLNQFN